MFESYNCCLLGLLRKFSLKAKGASDGVDMKLAGQRKLMRVNLRAFWTWWRAKEASGWTKKEGKKPLVEQEKLHFGQKKSQGQAIEASAWAKEA